MIFIFNLSEKELDFIKLVENKGRNSRDRFIEKVSEKERYLLCRGLQCVNQAIEFEWKREWKR